MKKLCRLLILVREKELLEDEVEISWEYFLFELVKNLGIIFSGGKRRRVRKCGGDHGESGCQQVMCESRE